MQALPSVRDRARLNRAIAAPDGQLSGMRLACRSFQAAIRRSASLKHLGIGRAPGGSLFLGNLPALILHFAATKAHFRIAA